MADTEQAPVHALLTDGTTIRIRRSHPGDHAGVLHLYGGMPDANLRLRFFAISRTSARQAAERVAAARVHLLPRRPHDPYLRRLR
ncbi:hypothetical protein [Streptomyces sp. NRRL S-340]|uniref:hypothetical protein n=1 Tax=Streptomyces sp. NRRL S-340 TaxID=1463901 RepID=UPI000568BE7C|nr:hypothetical protein [Streptomyces sp. NRRL S-340]